MYIASHRGTRIHAPENSLPGLISGYTSGGETIEFDLQLTRDGYVVLSHDGTVNRMVGDDGDAKRVIDMTLAELRGLDYSTGIGSPGLREHRNWPESFVYHRDQGDRVDIITLEEALEALPRRVPKLIELKHDSSLATGRGREFVDAVLEVMQAYDAIPEAVVYSMDPDVVRWIREDTPELRVCAFDYRMRIGDQIQLMREVNADGLVVHLRDVFDDDLGLTEFGTAFKSEFQERGLRVGAVLYPFRGRGVPWIISSEEYERMRSEDFIWSCATDSMIEMERYVRSGRVVVTERFHGAEVDRRRFSLGYAKRSRFCRVFQDDGIRVNLLPYEDMGTAGELDVERRLDCLEDQMRYALENWPYFSGGGIGVRRGIVGDFAAEVDYQIRDPMTQGLTLEMAVVNADPGEHQPPNGTNARQDSFFDPHGVPPYVGVEHNENDGYRISWNLGTEYENNRYGRPVGDGQTPQSGRLRLERRGSHFAAYYRNQVEAPDWICVGAVRNDFLNGSVFLRCVAKRWRQRREGSGYWPIMSNEVVFKNLAITVFG